MNTIGRFTVNLQRDIVDCDGALLGNVDGYFFEALDVFDLIDDRDHDVQSRLEYRMEFTHSLDHPRFLEGEEERRGLHDAQWG